MKLYKYEGIEEFRVDTLKENMLWMSLPDAFNDPFDCNINLRYTESLNDADDQPTRDAITTLYKDHEPEETYWFFDNEIIREIKSWANGTDQNIGPPLFVEKIKTRVKMFGLRCFSEVMDNPLMWGYYASSHEGFCVEYECSHMDVVMKGHGRYSLDPIVYMSELPEFSVTEVILSPHENQRRLYSTKSHHWMHEKEHRLTCFDLKASNSDLGKKIDLPDGIMVSAIYGGLKAHRDLIKNLKEAAKLLSVPFYKMEKDSNSYRLNYKLLS